MAGTVREFKMIAFPEVLYACLKEFAAAEKTKNRGAITAAVNRHLKGVEALCAKAGFAPGDEGKRKLVRTALDPATKNLVDEAAKRSGVDATNLMLLCLRHELGLRLVDPGRESILSRLKRRLARSR